MLEAICSETNNVDGDVKKVPTTEVVTMQIQLKRKLVLKYKLNIFKIYLAK